MKSIPEKLTKIEEMYHKLKKKKTSCLTVLKDNAENLYLFYSLEVFILIMLGSGINIFVIPMQ